MAFSEATEETDVNKAYEALGRLLFLDSSDRGLRAREVSRIEGMYGKEAVRTALSALQDEVPEPLDLHVELREKTSP